MKLKFTCNNLKELDFVVKRYKNNDNNFFNELYETFKKNIKEGDTIFIFEDFGKLSWCFNCSEIVGCGKFNKCQKYDNVNINRILKMKRICKTK